MKMCIFFLFCLNIIFFSFSTALQKLQKLNLPWSSNSKSFLLMHSPWFANSSVILLLNKMYILAEKIQFSDLKTHFSTFEGNLVHYIYMYAFRRHIYQKRFYFVSKCVLWEFNPQPFALQRQCSTTEPQENCNTVQTEWNKREQYMWDPLFRFSWFTLSFPFLCCLVPPSGKRQDVQDAIQFTIVIWTESY